MLDQANKELEAKKRCDKATHIDGKTGNPNPVKHGFVSQLSADVGVLADWFPLIHAFSPSSSIKARKDPQRQWPL